MQREAAGIPQEVPTMYLAATDLILASGRDENVQRHLQISHHIGLQLIALRFHTIELMNWKRQPRPVHAM